MKSLLLALYLAAPSLTTAMAQAPAPAAERTFAFAAPAREFQARFRWWWPHGLVETAQIERELQTMAANGFGGAEIADVHHSVRRPLDPAGHGWGTEPWIAAVKAAYRQAAELGMTLDLTIGPSWPAALPTVTPDDPAAATELAVGLASAPYRGAVPPPIQPPHREGTTQTPLLLQAARVVTPPREGEREQVIDGASVIDLSHLLGDGTVDWSPTEPGSWILISYWQRGSGQRPEGGPHTEPGSYVVDHFSTAGTQALIDFWETHILDDELRGLLRTAGGSLFEDSLELETDATHWTPGFLETFAERTGYALLPYLPLVVQHDEDPLFHYADFDATPILHDYWEVLGDLYLERHQHRLQEWAAGLGLQLRTQPYGLRTDAVHAAAHLDIAEGESLGFKNLDDYRSLAGGRDMGSHKVLSNEAAAYAGGAYATTWQKVLHTLNPIFAAGVNQTYLHGYAYAEVPDVRWPGFAAFSPYNGFPGYAEAWGPRTPNWQHAGDIADYFARVQWVLQQGQPQVDVAFLRQKGYAGSGFGAPWLTKEGGQLGWSHTFLSPALLQLPSAIVRGARLAPDGPAFRVLAFEGDAFAGKAERMPVEAAEKLLEFATAGLPMILVGDWSAPQPSGRAQPGEAGRLRALFAALDGAPSVVKVPARSDLEAAFAALAVDRPVEHAPLPLVHAHRRDGAIDYFFFCNTGTTPIRGATIRFHPTSPAAQPFLLDPWTGTVKDLAAAAGTSGDQVTLPLSLAPGDTWMIAFGPADTFAVEDALPAPLPGTQRLVLGDWTLEAESWTPGDTATQTRKTRSAHSLAELRPWTAIEGLADSSGIGTYRTRFELPREALNAAAVLLDLGALFDTARVRLNGRELPPLNPLAPASEVRGFLREGVNAIEIETPTTLNNQLRVSHPEVFAGNQRQAYGLRGPVTLSWD